MSSAKIVKNGSKEVLNVLGTRVSFLCEAEETDKKWSLMSVDLPENAGPPPHHHPWDEAYYVLEGRVRFIINDEEKIVEKGDFIYAPSGTIHGFFGAQKELSKLLIFDAPSTVGEFFKQCDKEVINFPEDLAKVPEIAIKYNMHFLPPS